MPNLRKSSTLSKATPRASQVLEDYDYWLQREYGKSGTYLTNAKTFLKTVKAAGTVISQLDTYANGKSITLQSFLRRLRKFLTLKGIDFIVNDLNEKKLPISNIYVKLFLASRQDRLRGELSNSTYATVLNGYFNFITDDLKFFNKRTAEKYVLSPASDYTKRLYRSVLKSFCQWALLYQEQKLTDLSSDQKKIQKGLKLISALSLREISSIIVRTSRSQIKRYHKESLTESQRAKLLTACDTSKERAIISLMAWNGLRTIEVSRLNVPDVDFNERKLSVWGKGKSKKNKDVIKLFKVATAEIKAYLKQARIQSGSLFPGLGKGDISALVNQLYDKAKLSKKGKKLTPHSLRHTAGQIMYDKGVQLEFIQKTLRHSSMETTMVYAQKAIDKNYFRKMPYKI
ncbi:MAG TPA: site-specific integrase [Cyclobacteriaceae bacterium]|nr:site-specific integrase [Cyclobacteriaceae bacterium]HMV09293.1 site-specific integrase [Cyclobacteriaceae bacterium]HMX01907.1 site-specific integrase [Cyclobacteriaceae bacterium]HMX50830.1 site-specific integrase [Cyclobacteriaceae bacterium]HMY94730.1 site-specific integrase [Cyclobacteriaceae bacterium]